MSGENRSELGNFAEEVYDAVKKQQRPKVMIVGAGVGSYRAHVSAQMVAALDKLHEVEIVEPDTTNIENTGLEKLRMEDFIVEPHPTDDFDGPTQCAWEYDARERGAVRFGNNRKHASKEKTKRLKKIAMASKRRNRK